MKRSTLIRRKRHLWSLALGFAVAALVPATAFAGLDPHGAQITVDPFASSQISAEDAYGMTTGTGSVLPSADQKAADAKIARSGYVRGDDFAPPRNVIVQTFDTGSPVAWGQIAFWSSIGAAAMLGLMLVGAATRRRSIRVAHP
jgi:hypothetical protein